MIQPFEITRDPDEQKWGAEITAFSEGEPTSLVIELDYDGFPVPEFEDMYLGEPSVNIVIDDEVVNVDLWTLRAVLDGLSGKCYRKGSARDAGVFEGVQREQYGGHREPERIP